MRIHRLQIQAFGPFADRVDVDLDRLSDAGLFLLTGATGAGKTSVLDAVCFALYGGVPGDRQIAKRLRSDHAAEGVAPAVTLELTLAGRRFRIDRSPAWERPKKRGSGTTTAQASVLVQERVAGQWVPRASRLDEAGHLLGGLLGMTQTQFCQVQLLPQGRFQTFLRAGSDDRQRLLHQLFRTSRFEAVEAWLRDHRRMLARDATRQQDHVSGLVSRFSEAALADLPDGWEQPRLADVANEVVPWADDLRHRATAAHDRARARLAACQADEQQAREAVERARALAERRSRHRVAAEERASLVEAAEEHARDLGRLAAGRRALAVLPHLEAADRSRRQHTDALAAAASDVSRAARLLGTDRLGPDDLSALADRASERWAAARARLPQVAELASLEQTVETDRSRLLELADLLADLDDEAAELPARVAAEATAELAARRAADAVGAAVAEVARVRDRLAAAREVVELSGLRDEADQLHRAAVDTVQATKEVWLDLQERRLTGMAAEIAVGLASGHDCPVCGSVDHPHPAQPLPGAPDGDAVRDARRAVDDAEVVRHARELALADLTARATAARERSDHASVASLEHDLMTSETELARLRETAATLDGATSRRAAAEERLDELRRRREALHGEQASAAAALAERERRLAGLSDDLAAALGGSGHDTLDALVTDLEEQVAALVAAARSREEAQRTSREADTAAARALAAAEEQGFTGPDDVAAAAVGAFELDDLQRRVDHHRQRLAAVEATLADPELVDAAALPEPDLASLDAALATADQALRAAQVDEATSRRRSARLDGLLDEIRTAVADWRPLLERHALADRMATLADGSSPDNRLRMRLSGYVLAARLAQVVAAANERLSAMLDGRYQLEHTDDRGAGESRGGLSLRVRDEWSGESRDPVTLSGGETFVVSLALALGLSDVISHEAGGAELDTLFVDEGFGTLDADSLDHVMDMLDSLRDGGRVVGVVSHVAELRDRIPAQLHVEKRRSGSRTTQAGTPTAMR